ncbi:hypothetical protein P7K49_000460 [Saguinus oedipus]|uniref:Uncharacterized protein n=1 Tax=Saguinus oedipus TaxID=9490 RepID=A0ABQ9WBS2_SAGOE|nr:hypothetical protein P7K49_000460 [Saguinus oedipus]
MSVFEKRHSIDELEQRLDGAERGESLLVGASAAAASVASARIPYLVVFRLPGPRNLFSTAGRALSPSPCRRLSRHRFRTTDSSWHNPSRALAAGLTHPRRSISTWAHLGPRPTMRRKVPPDCHAAPGAPLQQESPSPSPKTSRAADLSEQGGADGHCHGGSKGSKWV